MGFIWRKPQGVWLWGWNHVESIGGVDRIELGTENLFKVMLGVHQYHKIPHPLLHSTPSNSRRSYMNMLSGNPWQPISFGKLSFSNCFGIFSLLTKKRNWKQHLLLTSWKSKSNPVLAVICWDVTYVGGSNMICHIMSFFVQSSHLIYLTQLWPQWHYPSVLPSDSSCLVSSSIRNAWNHPQEARLAIEEYYLNGRSQRSDGTLEDSSQCIIEFHIGINIQNAKRLFFSPKDFLRKKRTHATQPKKQLWSVGQQQSINLGPWKISI